LPVIYGLCLTHQLKGAIIKMCKRNIMIGQKWIFAIVLSVLSVTSIAAELRCGWLENPTPANWWLNDREGSWTISAQGGYSVSDKSMDNLPKLNDNEYVRTNGNYGYACACLSVTTDKKNERILTIHKKGKQVLLKKCLEDRSIASHNKSENIYADHANADHTPYYIQVLTTSDVNKANKISNSLAQKGFKTAVTSVQGNNRILYRVRVGSYAGRDAVQAAQAKLKALFKGSKSIQSSIIINSRLEKTSAGQPVSSANVRKPVKPVVPTKITQPTQTQCYSQKVGQDLTIVQMTQAKNKISGYYAWVPKERDRGYGSFTGTITGKQIRAIHTLMIEGDIQTEELIFKRENNALIQGRGELVAQKDGSYRLKDPKKINWRDRLAKVDCRTVQEAINNAKEVQKIIRNKK